MVVRVFGATVEGVVGLPVAVEVDLSGGLPAFDIVGLPDGAVREARERVRAAIKNSGFQFPLRRITVSLAPADRRKEGSGLDLPIAVAILAADGQLRPRRPLERLLLVGELSLDGGLKAVRGTLAMGLMAKEAGFQAVVLPADSRPEAAWVRHPAFLGASLRDVIAYLEGKAEAAVVPSEPEPSHTYGDLETSLASRRRSGRFSSRRRAFIRRFLSARRAPEIARYRQKISGPIADRFDLVVDVPRPDGFSLWSAVPGGEPAPDGGPSGTPSGTSDLARRLAAAFERQRHRFRGTPFRFNGEMDVAFLRKAMSISPAARRLLTEAVRQAALTGRGAVRALRVARTIADLEDAAEVAEAHVAEALAFRVEGWDESL
ncbi:MAG: ATP-binding protein [Hydrogenibacillus schlegelii]|nr:ATP-binding protein [Hydrogenibacillus schlegelii]